MRHSNFEYIQDSTLFRNEISHFAVVGKQLNLSKAAEFLGITQSQVSKSMSSLENIMKKTLLIRKSRGVELTADGLVLLEKIHQIRSILDSKAGSSEQISTVRLGLHPSIAMQAYPQLIHPLLVENPNLKIETLFLTSLEVTRQVVDLKIDFGLVINPQKNPDIVARKLQSNFVGIWAQKKTPASGILYYHPDMLKVNRLLKRFDHFQKVAIADYEVIGEILKNQKNALGILPQAVAARYDLELALDQKLMTVDLNLIAHREKLKTPALKTVFQKMQDAFSKASL